MGTRARVVLYAQSEPQAAAAAGAAFDRISQLEAVMSDYRDDSEAMRLVQQPAGTWTAISEDFQDVLSICMFMTRASDGAFDITVGPLTHRWRRCKRERTLPSEAELAVLMDRVNPNHVERWAAPRGVQLKRDGMILDFGGIGKGYAAQEAANLLRDLGHSACLVEIGGDLVVGDPPPGKEGWSITIETGLKDVDRETRYLANAGVATSGDAEQFIEIDGVRYSHIIDPKTGLGVTERIAVTVIIPRSRYAFEGTNLGAFADAYASAISVLGSEHGKQLAEDHRVEAIIVKAKD